MKRFCRIGVAVLALAAMVGAAQAGEVRVTVTGVEARGGRLLATLQTEATFLQPAGSYFAMAAAPPQSGEIVLVFPNVTPGAYAFSVMHDANDNQIMEMAPSGMPLEGWAMSNGSRLMGPPTFDVVKFEVGAQPVTLTERITYPYVPGE